MDVFKIFEIDEYSTLEFIVVNINEHAAGLHHCIKRPHHVAHQQIMPIP